MKPVREFGRRMAGRDYVLRPGGHGAVRDGAGRVAVVVTTRGAFLPGGGQEHGETPRQALRREARDECGGTLRIGRRIAVADEILYAKGEKAYFRKRGTFFTADLVACDAGLATEPGHRLVWLPVRAALQRLGHESHRWAVRTSAPRSGKTKMSRGATPADITSAASTSRALRSG